MNGLLSNSSGVWINSPAPHFSDPDAVPSFEMAFGEGPGLPIVLWMHEPGVCRRCKAVRVMFVNRNGRTQCAVCDGEAVHVA